MRQFFPVGPGEILEQSRRRPDILTAMAGEIDLLVHQLRPASGQPSGAIVLLHGRGTNEFDLIPLLDELDPGRRLVGVTARAPLELTPGGFHWYVTRRVGYPDPETFGKTSETLARWLDALPEALGVPWSQTVLGGFSMGAVMSYAIGLGSGRPVPAAIIALSGFIPTVPGFSLDTTRLSGGFPVAIGHGTEDPVISVEFGRRARAELEEAGASVRYRETPMYHSVDPTFLHELQGWLGEVVKDASGESATARD